ncbi:hypothetical protein ANN_06420 [Periplaneta americana]|uniref:Uncharacterized protein n=1 Tax=Periplaneta americana TaxID=6978 RepID=A0ABQ8TDN6_PERAM|nr:hypothetical protein ANN_06420 [Periplaneta americana]
MKFLTIFKRKFFFFYFVVVVVVVVVVIIIIIITTTTTTINYNYNYQLVATEISGFDNTDFFLLGYLKDRVHTTCPQALDDLK